MQLRAWELQQLWEYLMQAVELVKYQVIKMKKLSYSPTNFGFKKLRYNNIATLSPECKKATSLRIFGVIFIFRMRKELVSNFIWWATVVMNSSLNYNTFSYQFAKHRWTSHRIDTNAITISDGELKFCWLHLKHEWVLMPSFNKIEDSQQRNI